MAVYNYIAVNENSKTLTGIIEAGSPADVRQLLHDQGLVPLEISPVGKENGTTTTSPTKWLRFVKTKKRVSIADLAVVTYQFATLLAAGLPVESTLASMSSEIDNPTLKEVLLGVRAKVLEGHTLASGMGDYPLVFPKLYVTSVAVGEKTGQLDRVLERLADYYEKQRFIQDKIFQALIYPTLLIIIANAIIIFLVIYVIPQITTVFAQTKQALPSLTLLLLAISSSLRNYGLYLLLAIILGIITFRIALKSFAFRYKYHLFLLKIPVIKKYIIAVNAARFSRTFGILFAAGVPVLDAMTSANNIISNLPIHRALEAAIIKVGEGSTIHQALQQTGYFSSLSNQLIASGEASGDLETMLEKSANFQEQNTANRLNTALALFEPILILTMGFIVLFVVLAVLLPIFEVNQLISPT